MTAATPEEISTLDADYLEGFKVILEREFLRVRDAQDIETESPRLLGFSRDVKRILTDFMNLLFDPLVNLTRFTTEGRADQLLSALRRMSDRPELLTVEELLQGAYGLTDEINSFLDSTFDRWARTAQPELDLLHRVEKNVTAIQSQCNHLISRVDTIALEELTSNAQSAVGRIAESEAKVASTLQNAEEAAGAIANSSLAEHFDVYAKTQRKAMWWLRGVGAVLLAGASALAGWFVFRTTTPLSWDNEVARLALTVPLLFLAYYSLREASHHRDAMQAATENAVRLKTVRAYTEALDDDQRRELFAALGQRVFTSTNASTGSSEPVDLEDPTALVTALSTLVSQVRK